MRLLLVCAAACLVVPGGLMPLCRKANYLHITPPFPGLNEVLKRKRVWYVSTKSVIKTIVRPSNGFSPYAFTEGAKLFLAGYLSIIKMLNTRCLSRYDDMRIVNLFCTSYLIPKCHE